MIIPDAENKEERNNLFPIFLKLESLDTLIAACLEKDRVKRPQTMDQVINALDRLSSRLAWTQVDASAWWSAYRANRKAAGVAEEPAMT